MFPSSKSYIFACLHGDSGVYQCCAMVAWWCQGTDVRKRKLTKPAKALCQNQSISNDRKYNILKHCACAIILRDKHQKSKIGLCKVQIIRV